MTEKEKSFLSPEKEGPLSFDGIIVLGRGIEQVNVGGERKWKPTRAIEKLSSGKQHSGTRIEGLTPEDGDELVVVAGANANTLAAVELFDELKKSGGQPSLVIFSAGRPDYLKNEKDKALSEGKILAEKFTGLEKDKIGETETLVLDKNKNTKDDILYALKAARDRGIKRVAIITISLHVERASEFAKLIMQENPELSNIEIQFIPSEELLEKRYSKSPHASKKFKEGLAKLKQSVAWKRTAEKEKSGVEALRQGKYNQSSQGYGFTK